MVRPLEKTTKDGKRYERSRQIEDAIDGALGQDLATLRRRAAIRDPQSLEFLPNECLVHLIRNARRGWNNDATSPPVVNALLPMLFRRCEGNLKKRVANEIPNAADVRQGIFDALADLFATDGKAEGNNALDFYEARFNLAFRMLRITHVNKALAEANARVALPSRLDEGETQEFETDDELLGRLAELTEKSASPEDAVFRKQVFLAIKALPFEERQALILCKYLGYEEESTDPKKKTAATICGVSGRTIRNRLKRAIQKLSRLKEDA